MQKFWQSKGKKIHSRNIDVSTYEYDGQRLVVEGVLRDDRYQDAYAMTGEKYPPGAIHHMAIRLLINCSNLLIEDIDVELISVPREICRETLNCLAGIKGMTVARGFTVEVKKLAGGPKGCTHLVALLLAMAPAIFQGYAAYQAQKPASPDPERAEMILLFLLNTCHTWREDGPNVELFKKIQQIK
jgi:hypothetical protein